MEWLVFRESKVRTPVANLQVTRAVNRMGDV